MKNLKIDKINGEVVYKDAEGWKFYCFENDIEKLKASQFDGEFEHPELQQEIEELYKEEYDELRLQSLKNLHNEILTEDQFSELEESEYVTNVDCVGNSGKYDGCTWYDVTFTDGEQIDVYLKN